MGISLNTKNLRRYKDIAVLLVKYGRSDLVKNAGLDEVLAEENLATGELPEKAESLADDLEKLGPTFIKLGQLLSTRSDLIPPAYLDALSRLQDQVEPFSFADVEQIVESELGVRISKAFSEFDAEPIAAASIGQVHRARLRDGRQVAVKVQRPKIREIIIQDLEALAEVAGFLDNHTETGAQFEFKKMLDEIRRTLLRELDYKQEANNLATMGRNLREFSRLVIPSPIDDFTTSRVLTMEYIRGQKITRLSPLTRMDIDGEVLADELFRAYLKQVLIDGFFHADPHPGNVFLTDDGRIALIDLGMVSRITPSMQERLLQLLLAISEGRSEEAATLAIRIGEKRERFDEQAFRQKVTDFIGRTQGADLEKIEIGKVMLEVSKIASECYIRLPSDLTMLGKTLMNLDQVGWTLYPKFDPNAAIRRHSLDLMRERMMHSLSFSNIFSNLIEVKDTLETLPRRVNKILERIANNELEIHVDAIDEHRLMEGLQKIANRITLGLVLAALIVGAAMLMNVPTTWRIFGYPGLAMIFFLAAAFGGVMLVLNILYNDEKAKRGK